MVPNLRLPRRLGTNLCTQKGNPDSGTRLVIEETREQEQTGYLWNKQGTGKAVRKAKYGARKKGQEIKSRESWSPGATRGERMADRKHLVPKGGEIGSSSQQGRRPNYCLTMVVRKGLGCPPLGPRQKAHSHDHYMNHEAKEDSGSMISMIGPT